MNKEKDSRGQGVKGKTGTILFHSDPGILEPLNPFN